MKSALQIKPIAVALLMFGGGFGDCSDFGKLHPHVVRSESFGGNKLCYFKHVDYVNLHRRETLALSRQSPLQFCNFKGGFVVFNGGVHCNFPQMAPLFAPLSAPSIKHAGGRANDSASATTNDSGKDKIGLHLIVFFLSFITGSVIGTIFVGPLFSRMILRKSSW
jgi:hypothetical protein